METNVKRVGFDGKEKSEGPQQDCDEVCGYSADVK